MLWRALDHFPGAEACISAARTRIETKPALVARKIGESPPSRSYHYELNAILRSIISKVECLERISPHFPARCKAAISLIPSLAVQDL